MYGVRVFVCAIHFVLLPIHTRKLESRNPVCMHLHVSTRFIIRLLFDIGGISKTRTHLLMEFQLEYGIGNVYRV